MRPKINKEIKHWISVITLGIVLGFGIQFVKAWTEPTLPPPGGNLGAPINTSGNWQIKNGSLGLKGSLVLGDETNDSPGLIFSPSGERYSYFDNSNGYTRLITQDGSGESVKFQIANDGLTYFTGRIGTNNLSPNSGYPSGWHGGIHSWDVWAEGTLGSAHDVVANDYLRGNGICIGGDCRTSWPQNQDNSAQIKRVFGGKFTMQSTETDVFVGDVRCPSGYVVLSCARCNASGTRTDLCMTDNNTPPVHGYYQRNVFIDMDDNGCVQGYYYYDGSESDEYKLMATCIKGVLE